MSAPSENQALIDALRKAGQVRIETVHADGIMAQIAVTDGGEVLSIRNLVEEWRDRPRERRGLAKLLTLDSFAAYVMREYEAPSFAALFARWSPTPAIEAVIDHDDEGHTTAWRRNRAIYEFPLTPEWKAWIDFAGKERSQRDFAAFLEERAIDIVIATTENAIGYAERAAVRFASAAQVMALSRGLRLNVSREVANEENLETGERNLVFREQHAGAGNQPLAIPRAFCVQVAPFEGGAAYQVPVRLRYRIDGGAVLWSIVIPGVERFLRDAVTEAAESVAAKTGCALFFGTDAGARTPGEG